MRASKHCCACHADEIAVRERMRPELVMPCPPGLEDLELLDVPGTWEATPVACIRSLRKLHLNGDGYLSASQLEMMTALQSLHASTPAVYAAVTGALPALTRLTRLELVADRDRHFESGLDPDAAPSTAQLAALLEDLSVLPSLWHLTVGGPAFESVQTLDGETALPPKLDVLHLDDPIKIKANNELLAFFDQPGRLSAVRIAVMSLGSDHKSKSDLKMAMMLRVPAYVIVTVHRFEERYHRVSTSYAS